MVGVLSRSATLVAEAVGSEPTDDEEAPSAVVLAATESETALSAGLTSALAVLSTSAILVVEAVGIEATLEVERLSAAVTLVISEIVLVEESVAGAAAVTTDVTVPMLVWTAKSLDTDEDATTSTTVGPSEGSVTVDNDMYGRSLSAVAVAVVSTEMSSGAVGFAVSGKARALDVMIGVSVVVLSLATAEVIVSLTAVVGSARLSVTVLETDSASPTRLVGDAGRSC